jgi:hypothetical protein
MGQWDNLASDEVIEITMESLNRHGITTYLTNNRDEAKSKALELIPHNSLVMTMTSVTLDTIGLSKEINESKHFESVKNKLNHMNRQSENLEMQMLGCAPEYAVGSVHAVTQSGEIVIASKTGSQLSAYAYGATHIIWVVSTKKIVFSLNDAFQRIYDYSLPKESERAKAAYGVESDVNKILIINNEINPGRINLIFVKEDLGF